MDSIKTDPSTATCLDVAKPKYSVAYMWTAGWIDPQRASRLSSTDLAGVRFPSSEVVEASTVGVQHTLEL